MYEYQFYQKRLFLYDCVTNQQMRRLYIYIYIYIYIYVVIHRQIFFVLSELISVASYILASRSWDQNPVDSNANPSF